MPNLLVVHDVVSEGLTIGQQNLVENLVRRSEELSFGLTFEALVG